MNLQRPAKRKKRNLQWRTDVLVVGGELSAQGVVNGLTDVRKRRRQVHA